MQQTEGKISVSTTNSLLITRITQYILFFSQQTSLWKSRPWWDLDRKSDYYTTGEHLCTSNDCY